MRSSKHNFENMSRDANGVMQVRGDVDFRLCGALWVLGYAGAGRLE